MIAGEDNGISMDKDSYINYQGRVPQTSISRKDMHTWFRGEAIYTAEVDVHFPNLTVGQTLSFAALARAPRNVPGGANRAVYAEHMKDAVAAMFGLTDTLDTIVGDDFVRGISGGERKRVTIAEAVLNGSPLQCWDNSTRGLDSANALNFCQSLRTSADIVGTAACVAIYQASESVYNLFDKVTLLYEGRQIYFGPSSEAADYFTNLGFERKARQSTVDFLTSMCSPRERIVRPGCEGTVPRTPDDFAMAWNNSEARAALLYNIEACGKQYKFRGEHYEKFLASRQLQKAKHQRMKSPYTLSYEQQIMLCLKRGYWRLKGDPSLTITQLFGNIIFCLVISSVFYNLPTTTSSFYSRVALLFWAILINAFSSSLEILTLYAQRPIVEKHSRYALYHPSAEALASMLIDLPYKITNAIIFNLILYFMTNLRREPGALFFFILISFFLTLTMSMLFRTTAAASRTIATALVPAGILMLALIIYTGFVIPIPYMRGWARWINYLNVIAYGFESLVINEFAGHNYSCSTFVPMGPSYNNVGPMEKICSVVGAAAGADFVNGTVYIEQSFSYYPSHKWRNLGTMIAFMVFFMATYLIASDTVSAKKPKGEVLLFLRGRAPKANDRKATMDVESTIESNHASVAEKNGTDVSPAIIKHTAVFAWSNICYDLKVSKENRRILDDIEGFVKPGTLTALMGISGAGKTTLLDVLSSRVSVGAVSGEKLINGQPTNESFQRETGYAQQQDLHLETSTVREALQFSALLRQPYDIPHVEKYAYVEEVIKILHMEEYADAIVGVPGEGLNIEQRKRLTIGVELAARPQLLLFLDEPTSGLDNQTSWSILDLLERLARNGQAILCTIHQPSAILFQRFDCLLFLAEGKSLYFGDIGGNSTILTNYFTANGASPCPPDANPAEWIIEITGSTPGSTTSINWASTWCSSPERQAILSEIGSIKEAGSKATPATPDTSLKSHSEFALPFSAQLPLLTLRILTHYYRSPTYILSRLALSTFTSLFIGFSFFNAPSTSNTLAGTQSQLFGIFMMYTIFGQLAQQSMPLFVQQRALYEARERKSRTVRWSVFVLGNVLVEAGVGVLAGVVMWVGWYWPMGLWKNAEPTDSVNERAVLMFLLVVTFLVFCSTFSSMIIVGVGTAENGGNIANLMFNLCLIFCGVLASPTTLPNFWIFMYHLSPLTYLVNAMISTALANTSIACSPVEYLHLRAPVGQSCAEYLHSYIQSVKGGYVLESGVGAGVGVGVGVAAAAVGECAYCPMSSTNEFLERVNSVYADRWRNLGIVWGYVVFNVLGAMGVYWVFRVEKKRGRRVKVGV